MEVYVTGLNLRTRRILLFLVIILSATAIFIAGRISAGRLADAAGLDDRALVLAENPGNPKAYPFR